MQASVALFAALAAQPGAEGELRKAHAEWSRAWRDKDAAAVERLAVPSFRYVSPAGANVDKTGLLAIIRSPGYRIDEGRHTEYSFQTVAAGAVVMTFRWQGRGEFDGKPWSDDQRCSFLWIRDRGAWRAAHEHCSDIR